MWPSMELPLDNSIKVVHFWHLFNPFQITKYKGAHNLQVNAKRIHKQMWRWSRTQLLSVGTCRSTASCRMCRTCAHVLDRAHDFRYTIFWKLHQEGLKRGSARWLGTTRLCQKGWVGQISRSITLMAKEDHQSSTAGRSHRIASCHVHSAIGCNGDIEHFFSQTGTSWREFRGLDRPGRSKDESRMVEPRWSSDRERERERERHLQGGAPEDYPKWVQKCYHSSRAFGTEQQKPPEPHRMHHRGVFSWWAGGPSLFQKGFVSGVSVGSFFCGSGCLKLVYQGLAQESRTVSQSGH